MEKNNRLRSLLFNPGFICLCLIFNGVFVFGLASAEHVHEIEIIDDVLPFYDGDIKVRDPRPGDEFPPMRVLLSRRRYWQQDGHMDVVVRLELPEGVDMIETHMEVCIRDAEGAEFSVFELDDLPDKPFIFHPELRDDFSGEGVIELAWCQGNQIIASDKQNFRVEKYQTGVPSSGTVKLTVANEDGVEVGGMPVTVGVPFPRGILEHGNNLRLVDEHGGEVGLQVRETARWSKYGSVKWVKCDFTVDLDGQAREFFLEYGPDVERRDLPDMVATQPSDGFPVLDNGRLRFEEGVWFDVRGDGEYVKVLNERALAGAFVEHEDGRVYRMDDEEYCQVEENGPENVVIRREGWYSHHESGVKFCRYVTRYVIHRNSAMLRIFHTWIFTGDGNRDRIANMGWEFDLSADRGPGGFLTSFGEDGEWLETDYLLQYHYDHFDIVKGDQSREFPGGRAPGAAMAGGKGVRLYFGAKDFWQNYPSELEFAKGSLWFHNWPRHNRPAPIITILRNRASKSGN